MKLKLIKAMLNICEWIADDIGKEVDKEDFINKIKVDLMAVGEEFKEEDIKIMFFGKLSKSIGVLVDIENSPSMHIEIEELDEEGIKILQVGFLS